MTSEAFVYLMPPGTTEFVTAGRIVLSTDPLGTTTGRFVYGRRYLSRKDAVPIDPIELKLDARTYETQRMHGLFGALRDAGPDFWGRRVIEKHAGKPMESELDYLLSGAISASSIRMRRASGLPQVPDRATAAGGFLPGNGTALR
jgi:serine/threonine-protein kinase HipA